MRRGFCCRFRKISGQKSRHRLAFHFECVKDKHEIVKEFLRLHCFKKTKPPYLTGLPVIFIPDKMHISNKYSKPGARVVAKWQVSMVSKLGVRTSWNIFGINMINTEHTISFCTMILRITWEDVHGKMWQLYHSIESTWNDEGILFGWEPQFGNQAQIMMTGLLPYIKPLCGATV